MYRGTFGRGKPRAAWRHDGRGPSGTAGGASRSALAQKGSDPHRGRTLFTRRSVRSIFPAAHVAGKNDFILSAASAGNQEGTPAPSWNFPRTEDEGRRPPFYCLLLPVAPTIRLAAKRLRRRDPVPGWLMRLSSTTRRARRPGVPPPVPRRSPTTQSRRQNYQALNDFVSPQDRDL